jgi:GT2 family glycosyltransferase/glycosyltransferase involved in cell wall biosynthesis
VVGVQADLRGPPADAPAWPDRHVAVVVPVHDAPRMTLDCLDSVFATVPAGTGVIVVDDASRDPGLVAALDGMAASGRIRLLRHAVNLGFPASANAGLRAAMAEGGDAVLLNSDTLVTPGWLDGLRACVHAGGDIGTATPLSNNGSILSYPDPDRLGSVPDAAAANRLARLAARADAAAGIDIPTAVGFCMYVRRECLQAVGVFRTDLFAQGYGEENDFCLRARHLGWRSVAATGVFVAHLGGRSFGLSTSRLIERNLDVIERLHPGYGALIDAHHAADPLAGARRRLDIARWEASFARPRRGAVADAGPVVLITHDNGGGVERVVRRRCADLAAEGRRAIVLRPVPARSGPKGTVPGQCVVGDGADGGFPNLRFAVPRELDVLARLLGRSRPTSLEVHHLMEHEHALLRLGRLLDMHLHDYAAFCPRVTLLNPARQYCGEPADPAVCDACVADGGRAAGDDLPVAALRARSAADLASARSVVVPSADAASRVRRHFPAVRALVRRLEDDLAFPPPSPMRVRPVRRVCVIGGIGPEKGYDVLLACARDAVARRLGLEFILVGHTPDDGRLLDTGRVFVTGPYMEADAAALVRAQDADIGWLPSI